MNAKPRLSFRTPLFRLLAPRDFSSLTCPKTKQSDHPFQRLDESSYLASVSVLAFKSSTPFTEPHHHLLLRSTISVSSASPTQEVRNLLFLQTMYSFIPRSHTIGILYPNSKAADMAVTEAAQVQGCHCQQP